MQNTYYLFQFTHPGGVRPCQRRKEQSDDMFQFTHPGGVRRYGWWQKCATRYVSIHAPGRGATLGQHLLCELERVSIHAPGRGATLATISLPRYLLFQFTHPGGVRPIRTGIQNTGIQSFNSRTREGCDPASCPQWCAGRVSIHAPGRGATFKQIDLAPDSKFQFTHPGGVRH